MKILLILSLLGTLAVSAEPTAQAPKVYVSKRKPVLIEWLRGKIVHIADGDTFTLLVNQQQIRIRLEGIDCPESNQPYGQAAKKALSALIWGKDKDIAVRKAGVDPYGRVLGWVFIKGQNINKTMIAKGLAWQYRYNKSPELAQLQQNAKNAKRGLWADRNPIPPWDWRRANSHAF